MLETEVAKFQNILNANPKIITAYLLGSTATGLATPTSDIDIAVYGTNFDYEDYKSLKQDLEQATTKSVDLSVITFDTDAFFVQQIIKHGVPIVIHDEHKKALMESKFLLKYYDQKYYLDKQNEYVKRKLNSLWWTRNFYAEK